MTDMHPARHRPGGEQLIGVLIPAVIARPQPPPAPLPTLPSPRRPGPKSLLIDAVRVDPSGRIWAITLLRALPWDTGHRIDIDYRDGVLVLRSAVDGGHAVGARGSLALPVPTRQICGIDTGTTVLLLAAAETSTMVICPATITVDHLTALFDQVAGEST